MPENAAAVEAGHRLGTFSKVLFPAIRIGYVILPKELQAKWRKLIGFGHLEPAEIREGIVILRSVMRENTD